MNIDLVSEIFKPEGIKAIEERRNATYVCETCIGTTAKDGGVEGMWNWLNYPVAIFYQPDASQIPEGGSPWFGIYVRRHLPDSEAAAYICNGISAVQTPIVGITADDGQIIYSRYRHDYRVSSDGSVWIDGGRDYTRHGGSHHGASFKLEDQPDRLVHLRIIGSELGPIS